MEPIQPDYFWQPSQQIEDTPEATLIYAIIESAWKDSYQLRPSYKRDLARHWFFSKPFNEYCALLNISAGAIQDYVTTQWRLKCPTSRKITGRSTNELT